MMLTEKPCFPPHLLEALGISEYAVDYDWCVVTVPLHALDILELYYGKNCKRVGNCLVGGGWVWLSN